MLYSGDDLYDDETTSGPFPREVNREINFEGEAAELRAPLLPESAGWYDDSPEEDDDAHLPDPIDGLEEL